MGIKIYLSWIFIVLCMYNTLSCLAEDTVGENHVGEVVFEIFSKGQWPQRAKASIFIEEERDKIWQLLTDYNHLADFTPDLLDSKLIRREDDTAIIEQKNKARILIFSKILSQEMSVKHEYPDKLIFKGTKGDMDIFEGKWILNKINDKGTLLTYDLKVKPNFYVPKWLFRLTFKKAVSNSLNAIRNRIIQIN
jgi:ribosome-associated toxin RatA of RatAB toxin-antitoxin module